MKSEKNYYILADLGEGIPSYDFVLKAKSEEEARKLASEILEKDYPEDPEDSKTFSCHEITAEQLLEQMTLN